MQDSFFLKGNLFNKDSEKIHCRLPRIQTYGSKFDAILAECFEITPQISGLPREHIARLMESGTKDEIQEAIDKLCVKIKEIAENENSSRNRDISASLNIKTIYKSLLSTYAQSFTSKQDSGVKFYSFYSNISRIQNYFCQKKKVICWQF